MSKPSFPEDFMSQFTTEEFNNLKCQNGTSSWGFCSHASLSIVLIDNFVDERVLTLLTKRNIGVPATIHSRYTEQFKLDLEKYNTQYETVEFIQLPHKSHDRFLIIDDDVYLLGASVKDMGTSLCAITKKEASSTTVLALLK